MLKTFRTKFHLLPPYLNSRIVLSITCLSLLLGCSIFSPETGNSPFPIEPEFNISVPTAGNSWVLDNGAYTYAGLVTSDGIQNWANPNHTIRTFFHLEKAGRVSLGIRAKVNGSVSKLKVVFKGEAQTIAVEGTGTQDLYIGDFQIDQPGYHFVDLIGLEKQTKVYADVKDILLGVRYEEEVKFVKDDFYFGRRGPSVHLNFAPPPEVDQVEWFYSEIRIPEGQDIMGSYFMANGFGEGYFGIQVNSPSERRILFSIWSPYKTDNPNEIPEEYKIKLLKKGAGVTTGEFGNEGSGGQSYKVFNWKSNIPYGFLVGAKPSVNGSTDYTAYFYDPATNRWNLIAQFRRPKTTTYLKNLYSFLENFIPEQGVIERRGLFQNQWVYGNSTWHELSTATFTADNTARKEYRLDYSGGIEGNAFYLKNCGFSNEIVEVYSKFERRKQGQAPRIDFSQLE